MILLNELKSCRQRLSEAIRKKDKIEIGLWEKIERRILEKIKRLMNPNGAK